MKIIIKWFVFAILSLLIIILLKVYLYDYKDKQWYSENKCINNNLQSDSNTVLCILATVHQVTPNFNHDSIYCILNQFKPDLILTEEDSSLFIYYHKGYNQTVEKTLSERIKMSFGIENESNEDKAVLKYKFFNSGVNIRPYDIENRNDYYIKTNFFSKEAKAYEKIKSLKEKNIVSKDYQEIWQEYCKVNDSINYLATQTPYILNQDLTNILSIRREVIRNEKIIKILKTNKGLMEYVSLFENDIIFYSNRNKKMAEHIINFISLYPKKRIIVLTGALHKVYLLNEIKPFQKRLKFVIKEYYDK